MLDSGFAAFRKPKLHALAYMGYELRQGLEGGSPLLLSPVAYACEQKEEQIGRVARLSRMVATKSLGLRLPQRYLLKSKALFRRRVNKRREAKLPV